MLSSKQPLENMNTDCTEQNPVKMSPYPISQETPEKTSLNNSTLDKSTTENTVYDLNSIVTQNTPKSQFLTDVSTQELDNISTRMMALKSFLINEIYDLRQQLVQIQLKEKQEKQDQSHNERCIIKELEIKLQHSQKENQTLRDENISKRNIIETVLNQNNELLKISQLSTNNRKNSSQGVLCHQSNKVMSSKNLVKIPQIKVSVVILIQSFNLTFL